MRSSWLMTSLLVVWAAAGCGTSQWSDTKRTATEQLLISDAMDRAVSRLDFRALAGRTVYLDNAPLRSITDHEYLTSSLRQHMLASGCILRDEQEDADYIVEARAGAVGTDRHDVLYGVPAVNVPTILPLSGIPSTIPEIPLAKKTDQRAVAKIALFAYNRETGRPVWQSGIVPMESRAKDVWFFGAGPFQKGTIYEGINFAGDRLNIPLVDPAGNPEDGSDSLSIADEAYFAEPEENLPQQLVEDENTEPPEKSGKKQKPHASDGRARDASTVVPADHQSPVGANLVTAPPSVGAPSDASAPEVEIRPVDSVPADSLPADPRVFDPPLPPDRFSPNALFRRLQR